MAFLHSSTQLKRQVWELLWEQETKSCTCAVCRAQPTVALFTVGCVGEGTPYALSWARRGSSRSPVGPPSACRHSAGRGTGERPAHPCALPAPA